MAKKTLKSATEEQLKAGAKKLQAQLATVEKAAEKLATKAKERLPAPADVKPDLPGVRRRLRKATSTVTRRKPARKASTTRSSTTASPTTAATAAPRKASGPDDTWTVADLRAEAKRRGMTGYSRKNKAQLLEELGR